MRAAGLERLPQRRPLAEQVLLPHELVERARPHARGQRAVGRQPVIRSFLGWVEEALHDAATIEVAQRLKLSDSVPVSTVVREWARLGALGFGGPPAHVALLRELTVERRRWIDAREFEDANAATQLIPGPASTQLAIYCAPAGRGDGRSDRRRPRVHPARGCC